MDFINFLRNVDRDLYDRSDKNALQRFARALARSGVDLKTLLSNNDASLSSFKPETLAKLADRYREYSKWTEAAKHLRRYLAQSKLSLPDGSLQFAFSVHDIEALERTAKLCQRSGHANHDNWLAATQAHLDLWRASVNLSLAEGTISVAMADSKHPDSEEFSGYVSRKNTISEMPGYKWLAVRRGQRAGILDVTITLPWDKVTAQTTARLSLLGLIAEKRGVDAIVEELIANDLEDTVLHILTERAEQESLNTARSAYLGLLNTPPIQATKAISVFVGTASESVGIAVLDRRGDIIEHEEVFDSDAVAEKLQTLIASHEPDAGILPITAEDLNRLDTVAEKLSVLPVQRIHDVALSEARKNLSMSKTEASAIVLGRRALKPGREWGRVDPLALKLGEFTREIDSERLLEILSEAKALSSWDRRNKNKSASKKGRHAGRLAVLAPGKRFNSFLKSIRDLKPGMTVDGVITNITRFGAFVNIGLSTEGMIHVSQLSLEFVEDPSQVVRIGEQVKARVLEVVPEKQRIALSLKPIMENARSDLRMAPGGGPPQPNRGAPKTRSAALADLDALFKK
jgi:predicted RNA-binding protein with RPS1 domain